MRLLAIADTHLGFEIGKTPEARKYVYNSFFECFRSIKHIAKKEKVDGILHGGDLFNRSKPRKKVLNEAYNIISEILDDGFSFYITPGNHERSKFPETLISYYPNCHFFSKLDIKNLDDWNLIGYPYIHKKPDLIIDKVNKISNNASEKPTLLLNHQLFSGATFGPHQFTFLEHHGALNPLKFSSRIKQVVTGHIHKAQVLFDGLVVYPGSLERTSFVEHIEPKGYLLLELEEDYHKITFRPLKPIDMNVFELNITNSKIDFNYLQKNIKKGYTRTLVRFTGRSLTKAEIETFYKHFNKIDYPLLVLSPNAVDRILKPFYDKCVPFNFPKIYRTHKKYS